MTDTFPPPNPGRRGWAELLALVGEIRRLTFGTLPPVEALGRIRDTFGGPHLAKVAGHEMEPDHCCSASEWHRRPREAMMRTPRVGSWLLAVVLVFCAGCAAPSVSPESDPGGRASVSPEPDTGVQVLAKADGWRAWLGPFHGVVEVAYDEAAAAQAWAENVPADLVRSSGDPTRPGLYGDLAASTSTAKCWWSTPRVSPAPARSG